MKRGGPLQRHKTLAAKTGLRRGGELARTSAPLRRTPINPVSAKRRRQNAERVVVVSAMRELVAGRCARCGRRDVPVHGHERLARAHGGDIIHPDCLLCAVCNSWAEDHPRVAAFTGWKVSSKWPQSPALEQWQAWALDGTVVDFTVLTDVAA